MCCEVSSDSDGDGENGGDRSHLEGSSQRVLQNLIAQWNKREEREGEGDCGLPG